MKEILLVILIIVPIRSFAQEEIIDGRDGNKYQVFELGGLLWFKDNLQFKTPMSWCSENPDSDACKVGNYYYPTDLINVCPSGWRVPTWIEFKRSIKQIENFYNLSDSIQYDQGKWPLYKDLLLEAEGIANLTLINDTAFFDIAATGWIQGNKWVPQEQTTLWVVHETSNTPQPHIHIRPNEIIMHSHGHNVIDKPKKLRRFAVRCVSDFN